MQISWSHLTFLNFAIANQIQKNDISFLYIQMKKIPSHILIYIIYRCIKLKIFLKMKYLTTNAGFEFNNVFETLSRT